MEACFVYWDNSNIIREAQRLAEERREGPNARYRVRLHFESLLALAHAGRAVERAYAVGSIPPELRQLWNRMEARGIEVSLFDRGDPHRGEQDMPDRLLQLRMLEDALDYNGDPGIAVLLSGDGAGYLVGAGFLRWSYFLGQFEGEVKVDSGRCRVPSKRCGAGPAETGGRIGLSAVAPGWGGGGKVPSFG